MRPPVTAVRYVTRYPTSPIPATAATAASPAGPSWSSPASGPVSGRPPMALSTASFNGHGRARSSRVSTRINPDTNDRLPRYGRRNPRNDRPSCSQRARRRSGGGSGSSEPPQPGSGPEARRHHGRHQDDPAATPATAATLGEVAPGAAAEGVVDSRGSPARWAATLPTGGPDAGAGAGAGAGAWAGAGVGAVGAGWLAERLSEPWWPPDPDPPDPWWPGPLWLPGPGLARAGTAAGTSTRKAPRRSRVRRVGNGSVLSGGALVRPRHRGWAGSLQW